MNVCVSVLKSKMMAEYAWNVKGITDTQKKYVYVLYTGKLH